MYTPYEDRTSWGNTTMEKKELGEMLRIKVNEFLSLDGKSGKNIQIQYADEKWLMGWEKKLGM